MVPYRAIVLKLGSGGTELTVQRLAKLLNVASVMSSFEQVKTLRRDWLSSDSGKLLVLK